MPTALIKDVNIEVAAGCWGGSQRPRAKGSGWQLTLRCPQGVFWGCAAERAAASGVLHVGVGS